MKKSRRLLALLLAVVMVFAMSTTALAASITISNGADGETYTAYKIFDVTVVTDDDGNETGYAYSISSTSGWLEFFTTYGKDGSNGVYTYTAGGCTLTLTLSTDGNTYVVTFDSSASDADEDEFAATLAAALADYAKTNNITKTAEITYNSGSDDEDEKDDAVTGFADLADGYYLITSSKGTVTMLDTATTETIEDKNPEPAVDKQVLEDSTSTYGESNTADIGDTVTFQTTITNVYGTTNLVLYDRMSNGLTYVEVTSVVVYEPTSTDENENYVYPETGTTVDDENYTVTTGGSDDGYTFKIAFENSWIETLTAGSYIVVTYTATVNGDAEIYTEANTNETYVTYGDAGESTKDYTYTYTFELDVYKYNSTNGALSGATFTLQNSNEEYATFYTTTNNDDETVYIFAGWSKTAATGDGSLSTGLTSYITSGEDGYIRIQGLDADTYTLTETTAPDGYNLLNKSITVVISDTGSLTVDSTANQTQVSVENTTGSELPSTGGMGTTVLYIVGACLVLGAAVLLVTRRRMSRG